MKKFLSVFLPVFAYLLLPALTIYSFFITYLIFEFKDIFRYIPSVFIYYTLITQLIIGQRLHFLDKIWGFPNIVRFHRFIVRIFGLAMIIHLLLQLPFNFQSPTLLTGLLLLVSIVVLIIVANIWVRSSRKPVDYNRFRMIHHLFYLVAILAYMHILLSSAFEHNTLGITVATIYFAVPFILKIGLIIKVLFRLPEFAISDVVRENNEVITIYAKQKTGKKLQALPGQYAYITFSKNAPLSIRKDVHPFSISNSSSETISFTIKALGDFTKNLYRDVTVGDEFRLHGPFGTFSYANYTYQKQLFIASGIGITPFLGMLEYMSLNDSAAKVDLHWFIKEAKDQIMLEKCAKINAKMPNLNIHYHTGMHRQEISTMLTEILQGENRLTGLFACAHKGVIASIHKIAKVYKVKVHDEVF